MDTLILRTTENKNPRPKFDKKEIERWTKNCKNESRLIYLKPMRQEIGEFVWYSNINASPVGLFNREDWYKRDKCDPWYLYQYEGVVEGLYELYDLEFVGLLVEPEVECKRCRRINRRWSGYLVPLDELRVRGRVYIPKEATTAREILKSKS